MLFAFNEGQLQWVFNVTSINLINKKIKIFFGLQNASFCFNPHGFVFKNG